MIIQLDKYQNKNRDKDTETEEHMEQFITYIDENVEKLQQEEKALAASDRKDEANLVKIRINVYGICKTVFGVAEKQSAGELLKEDYPKRLTKLSENWKVSYEKAKEHNDVEKVVIEELKLQTLEEVKDKFLELWGK